MEFTDNEIALIGIALIGTIHRDLDIDKTPYENVLEKIKQNLINRGESNEQKL